MNCCANNCQNQAERNDIMCDKHAALVVQFRAAFGCDRMAYEVLNFDHMAQRTLIDVNYTSLSRDINAT